MRIALKILLITFSFAICTHVSSQEVILVRHAKVNLETGGWMGAKKATVLRKSYDTSPIISFSADSVLNTLPECKTDTIYASSLTRSISTAWMLFGDSAIILSSDIFDEFELNIVHLPLLLPYKGWTSLSRVLWLLGVNKKSKTSYREAKERAGRITDFIEDRLKYNNQVILVTHGFLNRDISKELKRRNWHKIIDNGGKNLGSTVLRK